MDEGHTLLNQHTFVRQHNYLPLRTRGSKNTINIMLQVLYQFESAPRRCEGNFPWSTTNYN